MKKGIIASLAGVAGASASAIFMYKKEHDKLQKWVDLNCKNDAILKLFSQWLNLKQEGKSLVSYFKEEHYETIAIYGMNYLGQCLLKELENSDIEVKYAIDRNADNICLDSNNGYASLEIIKPEEKLQKVDAIVVTAFYFFDEIEEMLFEKIDCPILSLEDIIYEVEQ